MAQERNSGTIWVVNEYRVTRVKGNIPHWRIEHDGSSDIALTPEDAMGIIGDMLKTDFESGKGGEFKIMWENTGLGFVAPELEKIFTDASSVH